MMYLRNDIYYCSGCGQFHNRADDEKIHVAYTDMPANFALRVMGDRSGSFKPTERQARKKQRKKRGFGGDAIA